MRTVHSRFYAPLIAIVIAIALTASGLLALGWEKATTQASEAWVVVDSELDEDVATISQKACTEDEHGFGVGCTPWVQCEWTDFCTSFQYWPDTCAELGRGFHQAHPEEGSSIYAQSTDPCD